MLNLKRKNSRADSEMLREVIFGADRRTGDIVTMPWEGKETSDQNVVLLGPADRFTNVERFFVPEITALMAQDLRGKPETESEFKKMVKGESYNKALVEEFFRDFAESVKQ